VSASEEPRPQEPSVARRILNILSRESRRAIGVFRGSRLGIVGLSIVFIFAAIAILAPVISPYPRNFEAPESDRFEVSVYPHSVQPNLTYASPVAGPTTPLYSDRQGGVWIINYAREGFIFMDFTRHVLGTNRSPFDAGNTSLDFDISQDFSFSPQPVAPLRAVYYIVPGQNATNEQGPGQRSGAVAFFSARDFFAVDPFTKNLLFWSRVSFDPVWTGEDPASAGGMLLIPKESSISPFPGVPGREVGPYRYFYAADSSHVVVFEVSYVHGSDNTAPTGRVVLTENANLSAPPFVYYNQEQVTLPDDYRSGPGQAILLPLANGTLEVRNVNGTLRRWLPITLQGEPATVSSSIGFTRAPFPMDLSLPVKSASFVGLKILEVSTMSFVGEAALPNPTWESMGTPTSYRGATTYFGLFDPNAGTAGETHILRLNSTFALTPQFQPVFSGRLRTFFEVEERSKVFVFPESGGITMVTTTFGVESSVTPEAFPVRPDADVDLFSYAGALGGTLYGSALIPQELYGIWTDRLDGETVLFQLLGTVRTPLPPGSYPSGHYYILGTDFRGSDILTQLFYGTQIAFIVGLLAAVFSVGIGTLVGLLAGYFGKLVDTLLMRTTDIFLVLPFLPIVLILASILRPSIWVIILVLGIVGWPGIARVIRAQVLTLKERPFVDAARVAGASDLRLIFYQIAPNVLPFSFLYMSLNVAGAIVTEAALSFLGLGDASVISWGGMLSQVLTFGGALSAWWWLVPPGLAITLLSLGFYLMGRGFDEIINPRLRRR